jgi:O-antigen/teichoic acid export membrane protein
VRWNLASFAVVGMAGILMNVLVANLYGPATLGAFNQVLAFYIIGAQVATFGLHYSVLYHVSILAEEPGEAAAAIRAALGTAAAIAAPVCLVLWAASDLIAGSPAVAEGLRAALPGLFLFPLNKILMAALNGARRMRAFAVFNAARYVLIVAAIGGGYAAGLRPELVPLCLTVSEIALFAGLLAASTARLRSPAGASHSRPWVREHLRFGSRGVTGGLLVEANTRIDVLVLGAVATDAAVGIYSMGAVFAEGLAQLFLVLRNNVDPLFARMIAEKRWDQLAALIRWTKRAGYTAMAVVGVLAIGLYPLLIGLLVGRPEFADSWPVFAVLTAGLMVSAGFIPLGGILQQGGHPLAQSAYSASAAGLNLLGNLLLARPFGALGAALATAAAQALSPLVLRLLARRVLGVRL